MEIIILIILFLLFWYSLDKYFKEKSRFLKNKKIVKTYLQFKQKNINNSKKWEN